MSISNILIGVSLYILGHVFAWFQLNSQFVWEWWRNKPAVAVMLYSMPVGLCFWYATKFIFDETGEAWSARFMGFAASYFVFPLLTWLLLDESMFTPKTMLCISLSACILMIQIFWR